MYAVNIYNGFLVCGLATCVHLSHFNVFALSNHCIYSKYRALYEQSSFALFSPNCQKKFKSKVKLEIHNCIFLLGSESKGNLQSHELTVNVHRKGFHWLKR